jgi:hypothetical protein
MKTAVEWLVEQLFGDNEIIGCSDELLQQAKEMEKEQIRKSYCDGELHFVSKQIRTSEEYYNETFKSE